VRACRGARVASAQLGHSRCTETVIQPPPAALALVLACAHLQPALHHLLSVIRSCFQVQGTNGRGLQAYAGQLFYGRLTLPGSRTAEYKGAQLWLSATGLAERLRLKRRATRLLPPLPARVQQRLQSMRAAEHCFSLQPAWEAGRPVHTMVGCTRRSWLTSAHCSW
jgi:hypothetical protein